MTISNYPNGFANGVAIRGIPLLSMYGGDVFWVDSNAGFGDSGKGTHNRPWATLDYAVGRCAANHGDIIMVKAGHAETVATAGAIAPDVDGIAVVHLGVGADRPTYTFSAVDATMTVSGASIFMTNFLVKPSIDSVVSPIVISGPDCTIDFELQDATSEIECIRGVLTTAAADRLDLNLKYRGFLAGDALDTPIRLVGVDTARINVDFYGVADVAIVEFHTTACHDIDITGLFYNDGTALTKNVVDTVTGSTWSARGWDGESSANFAGGDNAALAVDDISAVATAVAVIDGLHDVPTKDATTDLYMRDVIGIKTDDAAAGAVSLEESLVAYAKQIVTEGIARDIIVGNIETDTGTTLPAQIVKGAKKSVASTTTADLFTITGLVEIINITGYLTDAIGAGANNTKLVMTPTGGTATDICSVLDVDASGQYGLLTITGTFANALTLTATAGIKAGGQAGTIMTTPGVLSLNCAATTTGAIDWYISYRSMSSDGLIVAA